MESLSNSHNGISLFFVVVAVFKKNYIRTVCSHGRYKRVMVDFLDCFYNFTIQWICSCGCNIGTVAGGTGGVGE